VDEDFYDHGLEMSLMHSDVACLPAVLSSASSYNLAVFSAKILVCSVV